MPSYSKNDIILVRYPFSDLSSAKVRRAVVVNRTPPSIRKLLALILGSRPNPSIASTPKNSIHGNESWFKPSPSAKPSLA
jgi:hypothetical protein